MKYLTTLLFSLVSMSALAGTTMNLEGTCSGTEVNQTPITVTYYSNFDGCRNTSRAAISHDRGAGSSLMTGTRSLRNGKDTYRFTSGAREILRLTFADSTGNTSGELRYRDENGKFQSVTLQCEVRDYEYAECAQ